MLPGALAQRRLAGAPTRRVPRPTSAIGSNLRAEEAIGYVRLEVRRAESTPRLRTGFLGRSVSPRLELHVLVGRGPRIVRDETEPRLRHARTHALQERELPDGQDHGLVVDQLLDSMEQRLALLRVELTCLLLEEPVDVGVSPVGVGATRDHERLHPGGGVAEDAAQPVDDVLQPLLLIRREEPRPLERAKPALDADGKKGVEDR